jgi:hypothetical protein
MAYKIVHTTFQAVDEEGKVHKILCRKEYEGNTLLGSPQYSTSDVQIVDQIDDQTFEVRHAGKILRKVGEED